MIDFEWDATKKKKTETHEKSSMDMVEEMDTMRSQYDFSQGVCGKHHKAYQQGTNVILLEPDLAKIFKDSESVNRVLRMLVDIADSQVHGRATHN